MYPFTNTEPAAAIWRFSEAHIFVIAYPRFHPQS
jgi:hypothetical protein